MNVLTTLSLARTALTDPVGLPEAHYERLIRSSDPEDPFVMFAVDGIDTVMNALDTEEHPARALATVIGLLSEIEDNVYTWDPDVSRLLGMALAAMYEAAEALTKAEGGE